MKTVFIRAIEATVDEKAAVLRKTTPKNYLTRFEVDPDSFRSLPKSPFAYWAGNSIVDAFSRFPRFESAGKIAQMGLSTKNDFRFLRLAWERLSEQAFTRPASGWLHFAKGGAFSRFYADIHLLINWRREGVEIEAEAIQKYPYLKGNAEWVLHRECNYLKQGLTWPRRTNGLSFRAMPAGCIFADKGPAAFVEGNDPLALMALAAVLNSSAFGALVAVQLARTELAQSYEVGLIQQTPVPDLAESDFALLGGLARESWSHKRRLDTRTEVSHAFALPALLLVQGGMLGDRTRAWSQMAVSVQAQLDALAAEIDDHAYRLYGFSAEDRQRIEQGFGAGGECDDGPDDDDELDETIAEADAAPLVASLLSWTLGVAFGRFDVRLATGDREVPAEPEPFDPLPVCSPGMLTGDDGLPVAMPPSGYPLAFPVDGIFVDDPGHPRDVVGAVRSVFETIFEDANARWHEATEILGTSDIRPWFAQDFFEPHIKRYSKSRRKAPIYWQLATASGAYSVWLYIHRATGDTLFRVLNDFVGPKLDHEKAKLDGLTQEAGANPSAAQRREIEQQETFVSELQRLKAEVARVAPLWTPDLDDGVILNFAPLWRLVPQSRSWQAECKKAWDKLVTGDYDWAHLAMRLWPERVVPKCIDDRSLAIAHGLEDVFWHEDDSGTWLKCRVDDAMVQTLIEERSSSTVKAALEDLLSAAPPTASKGRKPKGRSVSGRSAAPKSTPAPAPTRVTATDTVVDEATLSAVKRAIASVADGASKADVLAATGLSDGDWNKAIAALLDRGDVTRTGQKRGTRYHRSGGSHA